MFTEKQTEEIKEHLEKAQNPLFYYDNDADGLCAFLILRRALGKGKGVAIRSYPELNGSYAKKAQELNADYVFVLDKPVIAKDFVEEIDKLGLPLVWIDHHDMPKHDFESDFENLCIYNVARNKGKDKSDEPVTYLAYEIAKRKEDLWLAVAGCISDHYLPKFVSEFEGHYKEFWAKNVKKPFDALYRTEIGRIAMALNFGLKDSTTHIVQMQNYLIGCNGPQDVFLEVNANRSFRMKFEEIKKKYDELVERARESVQGKTIFFEYAGDLSISSLIANEVSYYNPGKYVVIAYKKEGVANLSIRGKKVREILNSVLREFEGATGGGHEDAVGARIKIDDLARFKEVFEREVKNGK
jgi:single-stranded DNA-specific DHH superfamily exonuclease